MSQRRVAFRQCDVTRALKAAQAAGAGRVIILRDGSIAIESEEDKERREAADRPSRRGKEIVL